MTRGRYRLPQLEDGLVWHTRSGPWVWARLGSVHYAALTPDERFGALERLRAVLASPEIGEAHLLVVNGARDPQPVPGPERWRPYAEAVAGWEAEAAYTDRVTYFGARLNTRAASAAAAGIVRLCRALGIASDRDGGEVERNAHRDHADQLLRTMNAQRWPVSPARAHELARLCARPLWLDHDLRADHVDRVSLERHPYVVRITTPGGDRWAANLVADPNLELADFPGGEWLAPFPDLEPMPELSVRFLLVPPADQAKVFTRARHAVADQIENIGNADKVGLALWEQQTTAEQLAHEVRQGRLPWLRMSLTVTVTGADPRELNGRVVDTIAAFGRRGVRLVQPRHDQQALQLEQAPGSTWRRRSWLATVPVTTLAGGMPHAVQRLGDATGPYRGQAVSPGRWPVRFDPLTLASADLPPIVAVTGKPGSGKSALTKCAGLFEPALRGARVLVLDPPGETTPVLDLLAEHGVPSRVVALDDRFAGALDPWAIWPTNPDQAALLATELVRIILAGMDLGLENAVAAAADATSRAERPSMATFAETLEGNAGIALRSYARTNLGRLIFGSGGERADLTAQVTVIRYVGLDLAGAGIPAGEWTVTNRISAAVLHASAALMGVLMTTTDPAARKIVVIDEAHEFTRSVSGRAQVLRLALMGRKRNLALWLSTQNAAHLGDDATLSSISVVFAHCCEGPETADVAALLRRPDNPDVLGMLPDLPAGTALMRDRFGNVGRVELIVPVAELWDAVQTTPPNPDETAPLITRREQPVTR